MEIQEWLQIGLDKGWTSEVSCYTHDGPDLTEEEAMKWDAGEDPCIFIIRIWE